MASLNKCFFIGNLTRDPEIKYMASGEAVANVSIACNEQWKNKNGEKQESVEFVNLVFYKKLAEIVGEYCKKGSSIHVEGKMKTRKWQTKEGQDRYTTEIIVNEMQMLGGSPEKAAPTCSFADMDDNIPFMRHGARGAGVDWRAM